MRTFQPVTPPKDMDPRVYKVLKRQNDYLHQLSAGMGKITDGNVPDQSGTTIIEAPVISDHGALDGLAPIVTGTTTLDYNDDHTQYALLAGRTAGQYLYGSRQASSSTWQTRGSFTTAASTSPGTSWGSIEVKQNAPVGTGIFLVLATKVFPDTGGGDTSVHDTFSDTPGNTWTKLKEFAEDNGVTTKTVSIWYTLVTTAITAGTATLTATFTTSQSYAAIEAYSFDLGAGASIALVDSDTLGENGVHSVGSMSLTTTGETLYIRGLSIQSGSGAYTPYLFTPTGGFTSLATDHTDSTLLGAGPYGFRARGEFRVLSEGIASQPSIAPVEDYGIASVYLAIQLTLGTPGLLNLSSIKATNAANILMSGSTIYANMDFLYFRNAGGTTNLSYIRGSDGAFVGPVEPTPENWLRLDATNSPVTGELTLNHDLILDGAVGTGNITAAGNFFLGGTNFADAKFQVDLDTNHSMLLKTNSQGGGIGTFISITDYNSPGNQADFSIEVIYGQEIKLQSIGPIPIVMYIDGVEKQRWDADGALSKFPILSDNLTFTDAETQTYNDVLVADVSRAGSGMTKAFVAAGDTITVPSGYQIIVSGGYEVVATGQLDIDAGGKLVVLKEVA